MTKKKEGRWRPLGSRIEIKLLEVEEKKTTGGIVIPVTRAARDGTIQATIVDFGPLAGYERIVSDNEILQTKKIHDFKVGQLILVNKNNVMSYMDPDAVVHHFLKSEDFIVAMWEE